MRDEDSGELWSADGAADPRRRRSTSPAMARATAASSTRARHRARAAAVRAARRSDQDLAAEDPQPLGRAPAAVDHRLCRMGAWHVARRLGAVHRHRDRCGDRRDVRAQSLEHRNSPAASPLPIWPAQQTAWTGDRAEVHRPQRRHSTEPAALSQARRCPARSARASIPAPRCRRRVELAAGETRRNRVLCSAGAVATHARALIARYREADLDARAGRSRTMGRRCSARSR